MKKGCLVVVAVIAVLAVLAVLSSRTELSRIDYTKVPRRASWQLTSRVVESLGLEPGDRVADIGAGDGYFVFPLADAVGPQGRVYAVDVEDELVKDLEEKAREKGYENVEAVLGEYGDPLLPDQEIDLVLLVNTYHHIDDRQAYFARLKADLAADGRVAIVEMRADLTGFARWIAHPDHWTPVDVMYEEMEEAGYLREESFDFLPVQSLEIFSDGASQDR